MEATEIVESSRFYRSYLYLSSLLLKKQNYRALNQLVYGTTFIKKILSRVTSS